MQISPNQLVLWTYHQLSGMIGPRSVRRRTPKVVPPACPFWRSTTVNQGCSAVNRPASSQVRELAGRRQDRGQIFQAGHAGSIPVTRSTLSLQVRRGATLF